ncbi:MAG: site-specific integrase [Porphyromonas sp.]|nr:site-specific integrase [Porphyromonas sp.]
MEKEKQTITFDQLFHLWIDDHKRFIKPQTYALYARYYIVHLKAFFGDKTSISGEDIQSFALRKVTEEGLSCKSLRHYLSVLGMVVKFGRDRGYNWNNPPLSVRYPKSAQESIGRRKTVVDSFTLAEQRKITQYIVDNFTLEGLGVLLCLYAGLRIGEVCALKWGDIDLRGKLINVSHSVNRVALVGDRLERSGSRVVYASPKTNSSVREIPLAPALFNLIKPLCLLYNSDHFVLNNGKTPYDRDSYRRRYLSLLSIVGVRPLKFHCLRHTFATRCIESGCDIKTTSALLGHATITTTLDVYVHPNEAQKHKELQKMNKSLGIATLLKKEKTTKLS